MGDDRKTKIVAAADDFEMEDLIKEEQTVIALTHFGYIKRMPVDTFHYILLLFFLFVILIEFLVSYLELLELVYL